MVVVNIDFSISEVTIIVLNMDLSTRRVVPNLVLHITRYRTAHLVYLMDTLDLWSLALSSRQEHSCSFTLIQAYVWSEQLNIRAHLHSEDEDIDQVLHAGGAVPVQLDGIEVIPYRLCDWLSLPLWVFELHSGHQISLPSPVNLTMVDKTSIPLYCTNCANISTEVTTLESIK